MGPWHKKRWKRNSVIPLNWNIENCGKNQTNEKWKWSWFYWWQNHSQFQDYLCWIIIKMLLLPVLMSTFNQKHTNYLWGYNNAFIDWLGGLAGSKPITKMGLYTTANFWLVKRETNVSRWGMSSYDVATLHLIAPMDFLAKFYPVFWCSSFLYDEV